MAVPPPPKPLEAPALTLHKQDFALWLDTTIAQLHAGQLDAVDAENLVAELEDMGKRQKNALKSNLRVVLLHLLKYQYQPSAFS